VVSKIDPYLSKPLEETSLDIQGFESPRLLMERVGEDLVPLLDLAHRPVISARQFNRQQLIQLSRLAAKYETEPQRITRPLTGKILISAFYEPSTRTRLSFESAWHRLGGDIMSITDPATTGIAKGESLYDVGEMLNHYGDLVVLRDSDDRAVYEMLETLRIPIINGGNGTDEHPTQAMADIYTILKAFPRLVDSERLASGQQVTIGIIGVPGRMRTIRSLLLYLSSFAAGIREVVLISELDEPFSEGQQGELEEAGLNIRITHDLDAELPQLDVVYMNAIAWTDGGYEQHGKGYRLDANSKLKHGAIVMHPLARGDELDRSLDNTPFNWYFAQARGAVFIRMALLSAILKSYS
jgi:aspartate carbamoyltransferase catalytic subunit